MRRPIFRRGDLSRSVCGQRSTTLLLYLIGCAAYLAVFHKARVGAFTEAEGRSLLARRPYDLRHAAVSTWLNAGVPPAQVAEWAGHTIDVLLRVYAKCIAGQQEEAKRRILEATKPDDAGSPDGSQG